MLFRSAVVFFLVFTFLEGNSQKMGTKEFIFGWTPPSPTEFMRKNHKKYLSDDEYKRLLSCEALAFYADIDLFNNKIVAIKYSNLSSEINKIGKSPDLDSVLARKIERILLDNIGVTKIKRLYSKEVPKDTLRYAITLDFNDKDRRRALNFK
jgi:hypothetical protein